MSRMKSRIATGVILGVIAYVCTGCLDTFAISQAGIVL